MRPNAQNPHRVVYAGPLSGTCLSRLDALREFNSSVAAFDIAPFFKNKSMLQRIDEKFFQRGGLFARTNAAFLKLCDDFKPEIAWIDKGFWLWPETLQALRQRRVFLIQHNTDALAPGRWLNRRSYRLLNDTLRFYDLYFTSNTIDHAALNSARGDTPRPSCELTFLGYDHKRFSNAPLPPDIARRWASDLLFVGHHEARTERGILALLDAGLSVRVHGEGWERAGARKRLVDAVSFKALDDTGYACALKGAKVGLCFFSELNQNQTAGRSFEIPASGTFLLAMRSAQHLECYKEGEEAEFFADHQELVDKARFYLANDEKRAQIARRGHERCITSDYSWRRFMFDDWNKTLKAYGAFQGSGFAPEACIERGSTANNSANRAAMEGEV